MDANELEILENILNGITRQALYRFSKDTLELEIPSDIHKEDLINSVLEEVETYQDQYDNLINFINDAQEWGRQHIFLFRSSSKSRKKIRKKTEKSIQKILNDNKIKLNLNEQSPLFLPSTEGYEIYKIEHDEGKRFSVSWAERRVFYSRLEQHDYVDASADIEYRAWRPHISRGILSLDWDLGTGQMMIRVSQSSRKTDYENGKNFALDFIHDLFSIDDWSARDIRKAIAQIKDSGEVSTKKYNQETTSGGRQSLQARDKNHGIEADSELSQASKAIKKRYASTYGNFFWNVDSKGVLKSEVHTTIDSKSNSFLVFGIQPEESVRYIIGRIIHHIR